MTREESPSFLRAFDPAQPPDPRQLVEGFLASRMVYYPGSGSDGQPIRVSNQERLAHCHLYADYGVPLDRLLRSIHQRCLENAPLAGLLGGAEGSTASLQAWPCKALLHPRSRAG